MSTRSDGGGMGPNELNRSLTIPLEGVRTAAVTVVLAPGAPFHRVRDHFVRAFGGPRPLSGHDLVLAASCAYSWMPTIPTLHLEALEDAVMVVNRIKEGTAPSAADLEPLRRLCNRSVIGMSKVLHFVAEDRFAIVDSRVGAFLKRNGVILDLTSIPSYLGYVDACRAACTTEAGKEVHSVVCDRLGFAVPPIRALELVMYSAGGS